MKKIIIIISVVAIAFLVVFYFKVYPAIKKKQILKLSYDASKVSSEYQKYLN